MILTTPTKNLRKRSNTNTAVTYGVAFKTQTRNSESKKARNPETKKPRFQETQKPRNRETKKPRNQQTQKPRNPEPWRVAK